MIGRTEKLQLERRLMSGDRLGGGIVFEALLKNAFDAINVEHFKAQRATAGRIQAVGAVAAGVDLVCFSGDKLLGGPQAGIIIGRKELIDKIKKHPLARAVRADKTCLAGITATLLHYLKDEAESEIPIWRMMSLTLEQIKVRAEAWRSALGQGEVIPSKSTVGGGSLPDECISTSVLALEVKSPDKFLKRLREGNPPVIARTENDKVLLDPRTVLEDVLLLKTLKQVLGF